VRRELVAGQAQLLQPGPHLLALAGQQLMDGARAELAGEVEPGEEAALALLGQIERGEEPVGEGRRPRRRELEQLARRPRAAWLEGHSEVAFVFEARQQGVELALLERPDAAEGLR